MWKAEETNKGNDYIQSPDKHERAAMDCTMGRIDIVIPQ